ncbi:MAG: GWxTD domain-containing protein [Candidatus Polarisedimenticolia bacterium]
MWYVMTHAEYAAYRHLSSETERQRFIRRFWDLRDPLPQTPQNELEQEFWRRVTAADGNFGQEVKPGWKTERGKVFIMLGPPLNVEVNQILADKTGTASWVYDLGEMPPALREVLKEALALPTDRRIVSVHVREENEGSRSIARGMPVQSSVLRPTESLPLAELLVRHIKGDAEPLRHLGRLMRVREAMEPPVRVDVSTQFVHIPVEARVDFRPGPGSSEGRRTAMAVTLGVRWADLEQAGITTFNPFGCVVRGHLTAAEDPSRRYNLSDSFAIEGPAGEAISSTGGLSFQAVAHVVPGRYVLDLAFEDLEERVMGALRDSIDIPDFGESGFSLSSMVLASRVERMDDVPSFLESGVTPFAFGPWRVIPRTRATYAPGEELRLFYRAYGAARDDRGLASLDITYQFYLEDGARWLPVGPSIQVGQATNVEQTWTVPVSGLPPGNYRLEVTVVDRLGGGASVRGALFTMSAAEPGSSPTP